MVNGRERKKSTDSQSSLSSSRHRGSSPNLEARTSTINPPRSPQRLEHAIMEKEPAYTTTPGAVGECGWVGTPLSNCTCQRAVSSAPPSRRDTAAQVIPQDSSDEHDIADITLVESESELSESGTANSGLYASSRRQSHFVKDKNACDTRQDNRGETNASEATMTEGRTSKDASLRAGDASDAWAECAQQVWEHEQATVEKWKDEINNLLIFAGLFSAVLTAFNVQYYISLQQQQPDPTAQALMIMSAQFIALAISVGHTNITQPNFPAFVNSSSVSPTPASAVSINALWFSSLVFSLSAASIAISVNQWLHHHTNRAATMSRQSVRIWYFRRRGLVEWRVPEIISILPVLLQISLALFLAGLVELLWTLNGIVAAIVTFLVSVLFIVSTCAALIPALAPDCPYKSSPGWWWFLTLRRVKCLFYPAAKIVRQQCCQIYLQHSGIHKPVARAIWDYLSRWCNALEISLKLTNWRDFDSHIVRSRMEQPEDKLVMLVEADAVIMDDSFLDKVVRPCLNDSDLKSALPAYYSILQRRAHWSDGSTDPPTMIWYSNEHDTYPVIAMGQISIDMLSRTAPWHAQHTHILHTLDNLLHAMPRTQSAVPVYSRLFSLLNREDLSQETRSKIVFWIYLFCDNVQVGVDDVQNLISCLPLVREHLDTISSIRVSTSILRLAGKLSASDFHMIRSGIDQTMVILTEQVTSPAAEYLVHSMDEDRFSWLTGNLLHACRDVAKLDAGLFDTDAVEALGHFAYSCTDLRSSERIRTQLSELLSWSEGSSTSSSRDDLQSSLNTNIFYETLHL